MGASTCERLAFADLIDYTAGELPAETAATIEDHLFTCADCGARAAQLEALVREVGQAARSALVGGFITDAVLNRLARDGVRVRIYTLSPGEVVPCAVWDGDEVLVLRLRGDFGGATEVQLSRRLAGAEVDPLTGRISGQVSASSPGEVLYADAAAIIRTLPAARVELTLTAREGADERVLGSYTLVHEGSLER